MAVRAILKLLMLASVGIAISALILYLYNFHREISQFNPVWKFLSVKITLFLSIWQRIVLKMIKFRDIVSLDQTAAPSEVLLDSEDYIDDAFVAIEMFALAVIVTRCYSYKDYEAKGKVRKRWYALAEIL